MQKIENYYDLSDLSREVAAEIGGDPAEVREITKVIFAKIAQRTGSAYAEAEEHPVVLRGIGSFSLSPYIGRNYVVNGNTVTRPNRYKITFDPATEFEKTVAENLPEGMQLEIISQ